MEIQIPIVDEYYVLVDHNHNASRGHARSQLETEEQVSPQIENSLEKLVKRFADGKTYLHLYLDLPGYQLYSPRTSNLSLQAKLSKVKFQDRSKVFYYTFPNSYPDLYAFIFTCRASKLTENYYLMRGVGSVEELRFICTTETSGLAIGEAPRLIAKPYNLVSGDRLHSSLFPEEKHLIHRYMMEGLHFFWTYLQAGLNRSKIILNPMTNQSRVISSSDHRFDKDEGFAISVSSVFIGTLIDYYRIESGTVGVNAQLAFVKDPEFRFLVYRYMREVFLAFLKHNLVASIEAEVVARIETGAIQDEELIRSCVKVLRQLIE